MKNKILAALLPLLLCAAAPKPSTEITDRYGRPLRAYLDGAAAADCAPVRLQEISPWLVLSTVAAEDKRFFSHPGVDFIAAARAFWQNSSKGRTVSGASTITQQLARALEPRRRGLRGKLAEMWAALRLEAAHSKEEILEGYFNSVPYGPLIIGAEAASRAYFGEPARDLSLAQAALLAGVPKSPVNYDPYRHPAAALARQKLILRRMLDLGLVGEEGYRLAAAEKIVFRPRRKHFDAPHFSDYVLRHAGGAGAVRTTLDLRVQEFAEAALRNHLGDIGGAHNIRNGAVLVLDNATGGVLAWVGSNDFFDAANAGQVDGVTALRQPGSALKPFLYALAVSRGATASDIIEDEPLYAAGGHAPMNYDKTYHGRVRLREALACSYNVPAVRTAEKVGVPAFLAKLHDFGFASLTRDAAFYGEGLALGNGEVTMLELANAYATLARGGVWLPVRVTPDASGAPARRAIGRAEAYIITSILSDNSARTPAFGEDSAFNLPFALAGKTGTSKDYRDNWALGYTPEWTVAVWVGNFDGEAMRRVSGITGAAPVLKETATELQKLYGATAFRRPPGVRTARVCPLSGLLPSAFCPATMEEVYLAGHVPSATCRDHLPAQQAAAAPDRAELKVKFPGEGDVFRIDPQTPAAAQAIFLRTSAGGDITWTVDGREVADRGQRAAWPLQAGRHTVFFTASGAGLPQRSKPVHFLVVR